MGRKPPARWQAATRTAPRALGQGFCNQPRQRYLANGRRESLASGGRESPGMVPSPGASRPPLAKGVSLQVLVRDLRQRLDADVAVEHLRALGLQLNLAPGQRHFFVAGLVARAGQHQVHLAVDDVNARLSYRQQLDGVPLANLLLVIDVADDPAVDPGELGATLAVGDWSLLRLAVAFH